MAILRAFWIILIAPFHPMYGFGLYQDDRRQQLMRRIAFWFSFSLLMALIYWLVKLSPAAFTDNTFLSWLTLFFIKFGGILLYFFIGGITCLILGMNSENLPFQMLTAVFTFSILPEFIFILGCFYWPEYYQEIKFLCYVWRAVIIVLGLYMNANTSMKNATICGVIVTIILYLCNYNYFEVIDVEGY